MSYFKFRNYSRERLNWKEVVCVGCGVFFSSCDSRKKFCGRECQLKINNMRHNRNKENKKKYTAKYRAQDPSYFSKRTREWKQKHKELDDAVYQSIRKQRTEWRNAHPELMDVYRVRNENKEMPEEIIEVKVACRILRRECFNQLKEEKS